MTKSELYHVRNALEAAQTEFEELVREKEWYVTDVIDLLNSATEIVETQIKETE